VVFRQRQRLGQAVSAVVWVIWDGEATWMRLSEPMARHLAGSGRGICGGQRLGSGLTRAVYLQNLDGDHDLDAYVDRGTSGEIWLNGGAGMMTDSRQRLYYSNQHAIALGDADGDGDADVVDNLDRDFGQGDDGQGPGK
jgi:hypothetical protein